MKSKITGIILFLILSMVACETKENHNLMIPVKLLELSNLNAKIKSIKDLNVNNAHDLGTMILSLQGMRSKGLICDTVIEDSTYWNWKSCTNCTYYTDEKGYDVLVVDYGEKGHNEWEKLDKEKIIWKWKVIKKKPGGSDENYLFWRETLNGYCRKMPEWNGNRDMLNFENTNCIYDWSSEDYEEISINEDNLTIILENEEIKYISRFKSEFKSDSHKLVEGSFICESSLGNIFTCKIIKPVVINYVCMHWIPVSGIEEGIFNNNTYRINYGDGICDNTYTITINGITREIEVNFEITIHLTR